MSTLNKLFGTSNVTTSINVPEEFGITKLDTLDNTLVLDRDFILKQDSYGIYSIIEFTNVPYIDYSKYDYDRRQFYNVDINDSLWRKYVPGDYIIEKDYTIDRNAHMSYVIFSMENVLPSYDSIYYGEGMPSENHELLTYLKVEEYQPITISVNKQQLTDITDYSFNIQPKLNDISPEKNMEFYFDKRNRIYSNIDFTKYDIDVNPLNLRIKLYNTISNVNVSCYMHTNNSKYSNYTPVIDYYILKLTGQTL